MPIPSPNLDDLRFQSDLVDEARKRIIQYCPEWTEYNLSDPGITLIELFAWMTEMLAYRLNRVPDKNYVKFLELLGLQFQPASSAKTELTFWLSTALPFSDNREMSVTIPAGLQARTIIDDNEEIVFSTDYSKEVFPPRLTQIRRDSEVHKNYHGRLGMETFLPFQDTPHQGETFYLGFAPDIDISGHILQLIFTCEAVEAVGIRRQDPPLVWECSVGDGKWSRLAPSTLPEEQDTTGGLNNPKGSLFLYLPLTAKPDAVFGQSAFWLRCRYEQREESQGVYNKSPRIVGLEVASWGSAVPSSHSQVVEGEQLGSTTGDAGQTFQLQNFPVLALQPGETLEIEESRFGETVFVPWQNLESFANATLYDRCFILEPATGQITLGPSVRQPDGSVRQYGRIPETGRAVRFSRYRYGGGIKGNVPANTLQTMLTSVAYLARVTNLRAASGGRDQETLDELKMRAQRELMAQKRAVTAQDYEQFMKNFSRSVARVKCLTPVSEGSGTPLPGAIELIVVPAIRDALLAGDLSRLYLFPEFIKEAGNYLDRYRLLTTSVHIRTPQYTGVQVRAEIVLQDFMSPDVIREKVVRCLQNYLSPIPLLDEGGELGDLFPKGWQGWEFGRGLFTAEISSLIQRVPGVKYVVEVQVFWRPVDPERERLRIAEIDVEEPLFPVQDKMLVIPENGLICSLAHQIEVIDMVEMFQKRKAKAND